MLAESRSCWYTWPGVLGMLGVPGAGLGGRRSSSVGPASCTQTLPEGWPEPAASEKGNKGQQRAACCAGRVAQMGTGFGPAAAAGEEPSSPQAPSRLQPPRFSSPCFVNSSAGAGGWEQLVNTPFCSSRRVGAARSHPQVFSPRLSPVRPTGVRVGLQVLVPCSSPGGLRVLGRAGPRCEGSSQTSPLCAAESFQLIWSCSEPFSQRGW